MTTRVERGGRPRLLLNAQYLPSSTDWRKAGGRHSPFELDTFVRAARHAEDAGFDAFFQADFSGVNRAGMQAGPPLSVFEPFQMAALLASATRRIAVMPTVSTLHTHPFSFARSLASLDRLSGGRAWINIVSSFRAGTGLGAVRTISRRRRHDQTAEFIEVARGLWGTWPPEANEPDLSTDRFIRGNLVRDLHHHGEFYDQPGPIDMPPLSAAFPFTLQATSSLDGLRLAARTADGVFAGTPTFGAARELRRILREQTVRAGRPAGDVALLPGCYIHVLDSNDGARLAFAERARRARAFHGPEALAQLLARFPALGLHDSSPHDRLPDLVLPDDPDDVFAEYGSTYLPLWDLARDRSQSVGDFVHEAITLSEHVRFVGTPERIAADIACWILDRGVDGFQIILGNDFDAVCEHIVPSVLATIAADADREISGHPPSIRRSVPG